MTVKATLAQIRELGVKVTRNSELAEYRLRFGTSEYFTEDEEDAVATARRMVGLPVEGDAPRFVRTRRPRRPSWYFAAVDAQKAFVERVQREEAATLRGI